MCKFLITLLIALLPLSLFAQVPGFQVLKDTTAFKASLDKMTQKIQTIESKFTQDKNLSVLSEKIVSQGYFCFKKENRIRWEYDKPYKYIIVIDNGKIFIKDDNKVNKFDMSSNKTFKEINGLITDCLQGNVSSNKVDFQVKYYENDKLYAVNMVALSKKMKELFSNIVLYFDKTDLVVSKLTMNEPSGDYTDFIFTDKKMNGPVADEKFVVK